MWWWWWWVGEGGVTASSSVQMKRTACHLCRKSKVMNTLFHGCLSRSELVARKQALGFNKGEQLLVCFGGAE